MSDVEKKKTTGTPRTEAIIGTERTTRNPFQEYAQALMLFKQVRIIERECLRMGFDAHAANVALACGKREQAIAIVQKKEDEGTVDIQTEKLMLKLGMKDELLRRVDKTMHQGHSSFMAEPLVLALLNQYPDDESIRDRAVILQRQAIHRHSFDDATMLAIALKDTKTAQELLKRSLEDDDNRPRRDDIYITRTSLGYAIEIVAALKQAGITEDEAMQEAISRFNDYANTRNYHIGEHLAIRIAPTLPDLALKAADAKLQDGVLDEAAQIVAALGPAYNETKVHLLQRAIQEENTEAAVSLAISLLPNYTDEAIAAMNICIGKQLFYQASKIAALLVENIQQQVVQTSQTVNIDTITNYFNQQQESGFVDTQELRTIGAIVTYPELQFFRERLREKHPEKEAELLIGYIQSHDLSVEETEEYARYFSTTIRQSVKSESVKESLDVLATAFTLFREDKPLDAGENLRKILRSDGITHSPYYPTLLNLYLDSDNEQSVGFVANALQHRPNTVSENEYLQLCDRLIEKGRFTYALHTYLDDTNNIAAIEALLQRNASQFNQFIETMAQLDGFANLLPRPHSIQFDKFFEAVDVFGGTITAGIYKRYTEITDENERAAFVENIKRALAQLYYNHELPADMQSSTLLADLIQLAYQPKLTTSQIQSYLNQLQQSDQIDRAEALAQRFTFPETGYPLTVRSVTFVLREEAKLKTADLQGWRKCLKDSKYTPNQSTAALLAAFLSGKKIPEGQYGQVIPLLLAPLARFDELEQFTRDFGNISEQNGYRFLTQLLEFQGVFIKDHLEAYKTQLKQLMLSGLPAQQHERVSTQIDQLSLETITQLFDPLRHKIQGELDKYKEVKTTEDDGHTYSAVVSKNTASFFAKAAVGICTAGDVNLYNNPDHFHINIVRDGKEFVANVQAYIIEVEGKSMLMLRGFNPTFGWIDTMSIEGFAETVLNAGKEFVRANKDRGISGLYISEPLPAWHALSNRDSIQNYLISRYIKPKNERQLANPFPIASTQNITKVYKVI